MRAFFRRLLALLDGTPTGARGQSLAELTLTLPVLLVMMLGMTELAWYANNYLNLLDVVREAGRFGSTRDPLEWPDGEEKNYSRLDCEEISTVFDKKPFENNTTPRGPDKDTYGYNDRGERLIGYYDGVACSVIGNMSPMEFDDEADDIVVSVFSFIVMNKGTANAQIRVVGRYPARTNECSAVETYDPFDWNRNGSGSDVGEDAARFDSDPEYIRGYVFRGNHEMELGGAYPCLGSAFSTMDVETRLNFEGNPDKQAKLKQATNYGLVLVEIFWSHHQLFGLPWFNLGPIDEAQVIHVWTFFPVSAAEPDIEGY